MGLEAATYISQLNPTNPVGAVDPVGQGDDHLRLIKSVLQASFPNINGAVTVTLANLNQWAGLGATYDWSGQHRHINGSAGAPAFSFVSDPNTGLFRVGNDTIGVAANGINTFEIGTFGVAVRAGSIYLLDGSAANPAIRFDADTNLGFYRRSADDMAISINGAQAIVLSTTQNAFTQAPVYVVNGSAAAPGLSFNSDTNTGFYSVGGNEIGITADGARVIHIVSASISGMTVRFDSGQIGVQTGTNTAPAYSFVGDPNTGIYNPQADSVGAAAGGIDVAQFRIIGGVPVVNGPDGSTSNPGYAFSNDQNTGLYRIGADQLGFSEGGTGFRIGFRNVPRSTTATTLAIGDNGKCVAVSAAINIPVSVFSAGDCVSIYNDSAASVNITISAGTLRLAGTTTTGTRALAPRGMATLWFNVGGATPEVIASGAGVS